MGKEKNDSSSLFPASNNTTNLDNTLAKLGSTLMSPPVPLTREVTNEENLQTHAGDENSGFSKNAKNKITQNNAINNGWQR